MHLVNFPDSSLRPGGETPFEHVATTSPVFSRDGTRFAVAFRSPVEAAHTGGVIRVYSWPACDTVASYRGHSGPVTSVAFSPDGRTLASGAEDATVLVWKIPQTKP